MILLKTPTTARLVGYEDPTVLAKIQAELTYTDGKIAFELANHRKNRGWYVSKYGLTSYKRREERLNADKTKSLLQQDEHGYYVPSGLAERVARLCGDQVEVRFEIPEPNLIPWEKKPHTLRTYQQNALASLIGARHAAVSLPTGSGKSLVITQLVKNYGLQTVVLTPSRSIAGQIYAELLSAFGKKYVGLFGDGKKHLGKLITVAIGASLTRVEPGSKEWEHFSKTAVFIGDEAHTLSADTLVNICYGVLAAAPYRMFVTATHMRNDGLGLVLDGITGPVVYQLEIEELVTEGYLAKPEITVYSVPSDTTHFSDDPNDMTRIHLYSSQRVAKLAAQVANDFVDQKKPVVILVDEVFQFGLLAKHFKHLAKFAHGTLTKENRQQVPSEHWDVDNDQLVADFNAGKIPILVGTSCISTGTDLKPTEALIYLQGGKSEIQVKQGIGRGTRGGYNAQVINPWTGNKKTTCQIVDFAVRVSSSDSPHSEVSYSPVYRHAMERIAIYKSITKSVKVVHLEQADC